MSICQAFFCEPMFRMTANVANDSNSDELFGRFAIIRMIRFRGLHLGVFLLIVLKRGENG